MKTKTLHEKECDVVHIPTYNNLATQGTTFCLGSTSLRSMVQQINLEDGEHVEGFQFQTLFPNFFPI